ncbi:hypothetical protein KPH14_013011, partial [Odynerus spinipes]
RAINPLILPTIAGAPSVVIADSLCKGISIDSAYALNML